MGTISLGAVVAGTDLASPGAHSALRKELQCRWKVVSQDS
jgi:hypothetical protein